MLTGVRFYICFWLRVLD